MNETYIKRQLTLSKLGIPMNKDIQEYVDYFNELISDPNKLTRKYVKYLNNKGYMYSKNGINLLFYCEEYFTFCVDYHKMWKKTKENFGLNYQENTDLFTCLLEEAFKCKVTTVLLVNEPVGGSFQNVE